MSNYLTIPINEQGVIVDDHIGGLFETALSGALNFDDVYIYSHGWSLDATRMMDWYNRFSIEYVAEVGKAYASDSTIFSQPSGHTLAIGVHWPAMISEDMNNPLEHLQALTFYTMEKRADSVGTHGVYAVLRLLLENSDFVTKPHRINIIGHSFGCKVVASALEAIYQDQSAGHLKIPDSITFNVAMLQGAFSGNMIDAGQCYGNIEELNLRLLVTHSDKDLACSKWFDLAHGHIDLFNKPASGKKALGAAGPTADSISAMGGADTIAVTPKFDPASVHGKKSSLWVADLTPLHAAHPENDDKWGGHHSDIFLPEIYLLLASFFYWAP